MLMTEYETTVIVRPDVTGEQVESALDRVREVIAKQGGKLIEIDHWGKKKLAYPMQKHPRGIYVRTHYLGLGGLVGELERNLRLNENVLRFLTVKMEERVESDARQEKEYVVPSYDEPDEPEDEAEFDALPGDGEEGESRAPRGDSEDANETAGDTVNDKASGEEAATAEAAESKE